MSERANEVKQKRNKNWVNFWKNSMKQNKTEKYRRNFEEVTKILKLMEEWKVLGKKMLKEVHFKNIDNMLEEDKIIEEHETILILWLESKKNWMEFFEFFLENAKINHKESKYYRRWINLKKEYKYWGKCREISTWK